MSAETLIVAPHPDDAVLSAYTLLNSEPRPDVLNVFTGVPEPGLLSHEDRLSGYADSGSMMQARIAEDREALDRFNIEPTNERLFDAQYQEEFASPWAGATINQDLAPYIRCYISQAGVVYLPAGIGGHRDHVAVRDTALAIIAEAPEVTARLYAEIPYACWYGWPEFVSGEGSEARSLDLRYYWSHYLPEKGLGDRHVVGLDEAERRAKLDTIKRYISQFDKLNQGQLGFLEDSETLAYEVFWDVVAVQAA